MNRRDVLKGAAWAVPVVAVSVTAPLAAASQVTRSRIAFTNVTATEGPKPNTVYANTRVQVLDGPDPVENMVLVICSNGHTETFHWPHVPGWGQTEQVYVEFPAAGDSTVTFHALADGVDAIDSAVTVKKPGWWA